MAGVERQPTSTQHLWQKQQEELVDEPWQQAWGG